MTEPPSRPCPRLPARILADLAAGVRFYSRLPLPPLSAADDPAAPPSMPRIGWSVPLAGGLIALPAAAVLVAATAPGLPPLLAACLALITELLVTGCFHEDGLADTFDGLGGGWTRERKLEIMRDSRIGSYGSAAMIMSLVTRAGALGALIGFAGPLGAAGAFVAGRGVTRLAALGVMTMVPAARGDGMAAAGVPSRADLLPGLPIAVALTLALVAPAFGAALSLAGLALVAAAMVLMARVCLKQIGGQTGDILGATQQIAEIAFLLTLATAAGAKP
ncbi:adenosylcobinamide-GDP ribazoletransferase [Pseudoxanthobacter sp.]|uniref:adenosylcobinamide-GDP ribazoletransferase n=1 Tax=Pseudoxanthobacter sp. TaxID=1925742 RepID=UPI002FE2CCB9